MRCRKIRKGMVELRTHREEGLIARGGRAVAHKYLWRYQIRRSQIAISKWIDKRLLGRMEEISAEAKLLIGLCYEICFLVKELRQLVARILVRRTDLPIKDAVKLLSTILRKQMRLVMTSNGTEMTEWEEGPDQRDDTPSKGWLNTLALGCLIDCQPRWMAELRIQKAAIRDWGPADWVKVWSCLQKLAEEEGEENHRLDNPFNIWACSCALRRLILSEARVQLRPEEVAVVVDAVFLFKVLRLKVFDLVGWVEVNAENLKIIGSLRQ
ncbi:hypothetical protein BY996DRAFT_6520133 [Phakopsora pachyrhizi]|nr:hypothetical protein BY996DRAFT_6520133 [Phakopsora pachyrhizi]